MLEVIEREGLLEHVRIQGDRLRNKLRELKRAHPADIDEIRGLGFLVGVALRREAQPVLEAARGEGLLLVGAGPRVLRLLPPLNVTAEEIDQAVGMLARALEAS